MLLITSFIALCEGAARFGIAPKPPVFSHAQVRMLIANSYNRILVVV